MKHQEIVLIPEALDIRLLPVPVMFGEADAVQPGTFGMLDQLIGFEVTIVGAGVGVRVQIDDHCPDTYIIPR